MAGITQAILGGAGAVAGTAGSLIVSGLANKNIQERLDKQQALIDRVYNERRNRNLIETPDSQSLLTADRENLLEAMRSARQTGVVAGASPESVALGQQQAVNESARIKSAIASEQNAATNGISTKPPP